jgi:hypothetical protein
MTDVTVRRFFSHPEAYLAKGRLEIEGISAYLADEHVVAVNWLWAQAVGGIRLIVTSDSAARANDILERDDSDILSDIPEWQLPPSRNECCSSCGSTAIVVPRWSRRAKALSFWLPGLVLVALMAVAFERYRCSNCGRRWS